ncbi:MULTISPECIES: hypothetical protein [unclassified Enterococcus]|uniref:hypothetical protein n=1 Tax=unclassified Enterococcus TaxID=2608891 RepID=UPI001551757B|nr:MULTISPECIES: hypothetical protein [unclassified Enterococcus]MBS7576417.1 hypothetical protein [Enterococcus sp. MMGLQ5-2]MBS7583649.1 hypothetical protein [Enterococcus sp. MMGLQ5-1]NPD11510.1 hypothetical protein [Enterococcus sp. MMGLQ5-1]NPD36254.1 hypothetical protein [Enterococcus sp. MMGLQ5-2]
MSAQANLNKIYELDSAISKLKAVKTELSAFDMDKYKTAGSGQWAGQKANQFSDQLDSAKSSYSSAKQQIEDAISDCKSKQRSLAASIDAIKHPIISAQAWSAALF